MHKTARQCVISNFVCVECGDVLPLPRNHGRQRKNGHVKDIWCPKCKEVTKFKEIKYKQHFQTMDGTMINV